VWGKPFRVKSFCLYFQPSTGDKPILVRFFPPRVELASLLLSRREYE